MSSLKLDSVPTFRTSVSSPAAEPRPAPQAKAAPAAANPFQADVFEAQEKSSGPKSGDKIKGSSLSPTLEPLQGTLDELAKKLAADSTLDTKDKLNAAIESELLKLKAEFNLSDDVFKEAFKEVTKLADRYTKSDPNVGTNGGYLQK